jgi:hypothetical protein
MNDASTDLQQLFGNVGIRHKLDALTAGLVLLCMQDVALDEEKVPQLVQVVE